MFNFFSPISTSLTQKLDSPNPVMKDILEESTCQRAFSNNVESVVKFFSERASELVSTCFDLSAPELSTKAYGILCQNNQDLNKLILEQDILPSISNKVFENPDPICISRLATVVKICITTLPSKISGYFNFLQRFTEYIYLPSVTEMFTNFFTNKVISQDFLNRDFQNTFLTIIQSTPVKFEEGLEGELIRRVNGSFKFLSLILSNPESSMIFETPICAPQNIEILLRHFDEPPEYVLEQQYNLLNIIVEKKPQDIARATQQFLDCLQFNPDTKNIHQYQISALQILTKLIKQEAVIEDKTVADIVISDHLPQKLVIGAKIFSCHTILHSAISNFVIESQSHPSLKSDVMNSFVPFISEIFNNAPEQTVQLRGFAWNLTKKIIEIDPDVRQNIPMDFYERLDEIVNSSYGGEVPQNVASDEDVINSLTPQQLATLFRLLTGAQ